jgi:hypothetical protein
MNLTFASFLASNLPAVFKSGFRLAHLLQEDKTVPGTTDGIMLMGILIMLTIVIPIVWTRRRWVR